MNYHEFIWVHSKINLWIIRGAFTIIHVFSFNTNVHELTTNYHEFIWVYSKINLWIIRGSFTIIHVLFILVHIFQPRIWRIKRILFVVKVGTFGDKGDVYLGVYA